MTAAGGLAVYEGGIHKGNFGAYVAGDRLRVAVVDGVDRYFRGSSLLYTSTKVPTYPLLVDTALYSQGASLADAVIGGNAVP